MAFATVSITILDEEMPAGGKRHRRRHVLAARLE
jgi:hypothetical protein